MNSSKAPYGVASWFLTVIVLISLLLTIAFGAQNIRLRYQLKHVQDEVTQFTDQSIELDSLRTQVETLKKQNQDLSKQLETSQNNTKSLQDQLDKANQQLNALKKKSTPKPAPRKRR